MIDRTRILRRAGARPGVLLALTLLLLGSSLAHAGDTYILRLIKYNDLDQNGINNEINTGVGEAPSGNALVGWEFRIYDSEGGLVAQGTTSVENQNANGDLGIRVSFPGLVSGQEYTVCESQQPGWVNTQPGTVDPTYGQPCETLTINSTSLVLRFFGNFNQLEAETVFRDRFENVP
ncbi:hypothetical protein [Wenzhouxiangella marina]|nr:hypothetical protein [Wenzhouxiangella marina]MBB6087849.1 hypothetical protein [Wenzhouxiangella marina]